MNGHKPIVSWVDLLIVEMIKMVDRGIMVVVVDIMETANVLDGPCGLRYVLESVSHTHTHVSTTLFQPSSHTIVLSLVFVFF